MKHLSFAKPLVMGILNVTPDSFFDGGNYLDPERAYNHLQQLIADGADIIDIGAASSRPGYQPASSENELTRLQPLLCRLAGDIELPWSIDTDKVEVAEAALAAGAAIINNTGKPSVQMAQLAKKYNAYLVMMFRGPFAASDIMAELKDFFAAAIAEAVAVGVEKEQIILDPGIGFDMTMEQCITIVREQEQLVALGYPLLMGMSNKRFVGTISGGADISERLPANIATEIFSIEKGAAILRVHNVAATVRALQAYQTLRGKN